MYPLFWYGFFDPNDPSPHRNVLTFVGYFLGPFGLLSAYPMLLGAGLILAGVGYRFVYPETSRPDGNRLGTILTSIGAIMTGLCGLCTFSVNHAEGAGPRVDWSVLAFGAPEILFGSLLFCLGLELRRRARRAKARPDEPGG